MKKYPQQYFFSDLRTKAKDHCIVPGFFFVKGVVHVNNN